MSTLPILVAPPGRADAVLDALVDWSALGLLRSFVWWRVEGEADRRQPILRVTGGRQEATTLADVMVEESFDRFRLCVLVPLFADQTQIPFRTTQGLKDQLLKSGRSELTAARLLISRTENYADNGDVAHQGWHNLLIAPQDSQGPSRSHDVLPPSNDPREIALYAAPALASLAGMWSEVDDSPLDDLDLLPNNYIRLARSFYRRLDAREVEDSLIAEVGSTADGLPLPEARVGRIVFVEDSGLAAQQMAESLWRHHADVLGGHRERQPEMTSEKIGVWRAIKMLFAFLGAALKRAPAQWWKATVAHASASIASSVTRTVFGASPSAYSVVVNGVGSDGRPASWSNTMAAAGNLKAAFPETQSDQHVVHRSEGTLWRDFVAGAFTLADGMERVAAMPPIQIGPYIGVMRRPDEIAPGPAGSYQMPGILGEELGITEIRPFDLLTAGQVGKRLEALVADPQLAREAIVINQRYREWGKACSHTFTAQVGRRLAARFAEVMQEAQEYLRFFDRYSKDSVDGRANQEQARQRHLATWLRILLGMLLLVLIVGVGLVAFSVIGWVAFAIIAAVGLVSWLSSSLVLFIRAQQALFQELNRLESDRTQMKVVEQNLKLALQDLTRLGDAYSQFLCWGEVLGQLLAHPFGTFHGRQRDGSRLGGAMPASTRLGVAAPVPDAMAEAIAQLRRKVFATGWLEQPWDALLSDASRRLGPSAYRLRTEPSLMFDESGEGTDSLLTSWVAALRKDGVGAAGSQALKDRVLGELHGSAELSSLLLANVRTGTAGTSHTRDSFMAGIGERHQPDDAFDRSLLGDEARAHELGLVEHRFFREGANDGLGRAAVQVDISDGVAPYQLAFIKARSTHQTFDLPDLEDF